MSTQPPNLTLTQRCSALAAALDRYRETVCDEYDETLHDVIDRVATTGSLGKMDLGALLLWKRIRIAAWAEELLCKPDSDVRRITAKSVTAASWPGPTAATPANSSPGPGPRSSPG